MSFELELALDRLEAELAAELPQHLRAFARAYAAGAGEPPAPEATHRQASIILARRALAVDSLAPRGLALLRLLAPIAIEDDPDVAAARSARPQTWDAWTALATARDAASRIRLGAGQLAWRHWLHGAASEPSGATAWPPPLDGWHAEAPPIAPVFIERAWRDLADRHGARGTCRIVDPQRDGRTAPRPRTFAIAPGEAIVVLGPVTTPAMRFAALHELGHALGALLSPQPLPRVVDEALASYVARLVEREADLDLVWHTPLAEPARHRRLVSCRALASCERDLRPEPQIAAPPWALWFDSGAQAAYVAAEAIADRWWSALGAAPESGALAAALADEVARIDRETLARRPA